MMNAVGLVVEYNPFHNGHLYHLQQAKKVSSSDASVAVMSGHFLQRGEPALFDKWTRAEMALANGCDLVLELPTIYATSSAEWFAYGAVATLHATGVVQSLCFGSESGQITPLQIAAKTIVHQQHTLLPLLREQLQLGLNYPKAFNVALQSLLKNDDNWVQQPISLDQPNHTLGLHYLAALERLNSTMATYTISREQAQYHDHTLMQGHIASATAIRKQLLQSKQLNSIASFIPKPTLDVLDRVINDDKLEATDWETFAKPLFYQLSVQRPEQLTQYREIEEGLEHRLIDKGKQLTAYSVQRLIEQCSTKRYTRTKLQRALLAILLQHHKHYCTREALSSGIQYIRVLGFNEKGKELLRKMKHTATAPVIHKPSQFEGKSTFLELDVAATRCYMQFSAPSSPKAQQADYTRSPIML